mmetsp:Transcript_13998/g.20493  ORF Transcript_13998/g.20493 Transcript_13998/m.20493 type:complete len:224 (-) Transcript_13998:393-1064(-)
MKRYRLQKWKQGQLQKQEQLLIEKLSRRLRWKQQDRRSFKVIKINQHSSKCFLGFVAPERQVSLLLLKLVHPFEMNLKFRWNRRKNLNTSNLLKLLRSLHPKVSHPSPNHPKRLNQSPLLNLFPRQPQLGGELEPQRNRIGKRVCPKFRKRRPEFQLGWQNKGNLNLLVVAGLMLPPLVERQLGLVILPDLRPLHLQLHLQTPASNKLVQSSRWLLQLPKSKQ